MKKKKKSNWPNIEGPFSDICDNGFRKIRQFALNRRY